MAAPGESQLSIHCFRSWRPGNCSKLQDTLARRAAALDAFAIHIESEAAQGKDVDVGKYVSLCSVLNRISGTLGLRRVQLDISPKEELKRWLEGNDGEDDDADDSKKGGGE